MPNNTPTPRKRTTRNAAALQRSSSGRVTYSAPDRNSTARRQTINASSSTARRHTSGSTASPAPGRNNTDRAIYVGQRPKKSKFPFALAGCIALVLVFAAVGFGLLGGSGNNDATNEDSQDSALVATDDAAKAKKVTITFAGDCTLGTDVNLDQSTSFNAKYNEVNDPSYFFKNVADIFKNDDLSVVNFEGTLTESTTREDKPYAFKGPAEYADIVVQGNIEATAFDNNHSYDYGTQSYTDTIEALEDAGLLVFGEDTIGYYDTNGVKVALIAASVIVKGSQAFDGIEELIKEADENDANITIVYYHWGIERNYVPTADQVKLAHMTVDAGADLVMGSHPHVIQGYEKYNGRYIVYSLRNFCFGGNANPTDKDCMMFQQTFTVEGGKVAKDDDITVIPCSISSTSSTNNYQPTPAEGSEKERIQAKIDESNASIATLSKQVSGS